KDRNFDVKTNPIITADSKTLFQKLLLLTRDFIPALHFQSLKWQLIPGERNAKNVSDFCKTVGQPEWWTVYKALHDR
ncbi:unnamed protein product, partial [Orchesella dallaii]